LTDKTDWVQFDRLLKSTTNGNFVPLEKLQAAWTNFLDCDEAFVLNQGKPLRYFCSNITRFWDARNGSTESHLERLRRKV
jgi:hypothetical protein